MVPPPVARLSRVWFPSGGIAVSGAEDAYSKLIRAGFLRQAHSGIFHMLPLGRRVQDKVEALIAGYMENQLAASRVSLSSISSQALWERSGRLENVASELFKFSDRKDVAFLLAPTHEEEITSLVARTVKSYKELPLRLYQITRKYRDEFRPRHGLLRGREFIMKDLYTFDSSVDAALKTYDEVRTSYASIFSDMKLPVLAAKASSGDMGGDLSHEYHLPTPLGEDRVVSCDSCGYVVNEEIADSAVSLRVLEGTPIQAWRGITKDRTKLVNVWYPRSMQSLDGISREYADHDINLLAVKSVVPDLDSGVEDTLSLWATATASETGTAKEVVNIVDSRLPHPLPKTLESNSSTVFGWPTALPPPALPLSTSSHRTNGLLRVRTGDKCPQCSSGTLKVERAIELGHTFFLGTRYSEPLRAMVTVPPATQAVPIQMGCHGIGISRVIGAVAEHLADKIGLNWPISIAPYSCVVIAGKDADDADAVQVCGRITNTQGNESLSLDVVLDDRSRPLPWKLTDADLIGFPIIVVLGREWAAARRVEVQCRRLSMKEGVELEDLPHLIRQLHALL